MEADGRVEGGLNLGADGAGAAGAGQRGRWARRVGRGEAAQLVHTTLLGELQF